MSENPPHTEFVPEIIPFEDRAYHEAFLSDRLEYEWNPPIYEEEPVDDSERFTYVATFIEDLDWSTDAILSADKLCVVNDYRTFDDKVNIKIKNCKLTIPELSEILGIYPSDISKS
jgi:hypothetical protein